MHRTSPSNRAGVSHTRTTTGEIEIHRDLNDHIITVHLADDTLCTYNGPAFYPDRDGRSVPIQFLVQPPRVDEPRMSERLSRTKSPTTRPTSSNVGHPLARSLGTQNAISFSIRPPNCPRLTRAGSPRPRRARAYKQSEESQSRVDTRRSDTTPVSPSAVNLIVLS